MLVFTAVGRNKICWWILAVIKQLVLRIPLMNRSFIILSSARSGSTLLRFLLNGHPKITCLGELLNRKFLNNHQLCGMSSYVLVNYILASLLPRKLWLPFTGFKLFHEQMEFCNLRFEEILAALLCPPVIVLFRENMLDTYTSLQIAFKTDVWYSEDESSREERIEIDWQEFVGYVANLRERWKRSMMGIPLNAKVFFVSYEELTTNKDRTMNKIFQFLNLEDCNVETTAKKQNPLSLREKIINYKQIKELTLQNHFDYTITKHWLRTTWTQGKKLPDSNENC
ncbi:uncharacterized protein [Dysidea avara]|uniref:uncharacterized protein n=1 Tax=Dysidea avara TaxID=196820 RepID=UPI003320B653